MEGEALEVDGRRASGPPRGAGRARRRAGASRSPPRRRRGRRRRSRDRQRVPGPRPTPPCGSRGRPARGSGSVRWSQGVSTSTSPSKAWRASRPRGRPDGQRRRPRRPASAAEQGVAEAVPVALGDRDQAGTARARTPVEVLAPASAPSTCRVKVIDVSRTGHRGQVGVKALYSKGFSGIVPLAEVLDGLAAGAELELDEAEEVVLGVEGVGDAAQVVDARAAVERVAHHRATGWRCWGAPRACGRRWRRRSTRRARRPVPPSSPRAASPSWRAR